MKNSLIFTSFTAVVIVFNLSIIVYCNADSLCLWGKLD